ncbi:citrate synthase [Obba rivulosa]|uniref:Citrate synthase n=1 Tax=Obba rivulosa TaxID=1052685 RepID=A0A8E2ASL6_9APHY|nr:citrate synthase [Obba rivulosa]
MFLELIPETAVRTIFDAVEERLPERLALAAKLIKEHSKAPLHTVTVENVMGGMRGLPAVLWEVSGTSQAGITYHGRTLRELQELLPRWPGSEQVSPEAMLWYLYTASVPSAAELAQFARELVRRAARLPAEALRFCDALPQDVDSSAQMIMTLTAMGPHSQFAHALAEGVPKAQMWRHALEDALDSHIFVPLLAARIYANKFRDGQGKATPLNVHGDMAENFAIRMGRSGDKPFTELIRLYWALHMDHGANVSAHSMRLSSSAWTDPYPTMATGLIAGTGILHAGAILQAIQYNQSMLAALGPAPSPAAIDAHVSATLAAGRIVPGFGHALLRGVDPRLAPIVKFVQGCSLPPESEGGQLLQLIGQTSTVVPAVLRRRAPKIKSPAPNVDSLSGCLMYAFGLELDFVLLVMACSRGMGFMSQYVWDRALGLPIERPLSITMDQIVAKL